MGLSSSIIYSYNIEEFVGAEVWNKINSMMLRIHIWTLSAVIFACKMNAAASTFLQPPIFKHSLVWTCRLYTLISLNLELTHFKFQITRIIKMDPKCQNNPKIKSKSNARIEGNKENENNCTIWVDPKTIWTWPQPSK